MDDIILRLEGIQKSFGDTKVLSGIDLDVKRGEFVTLLGASGCGKTTTLRIIAGLESPDTGRVLLEGEDVTSAQPNKRDVNTVFQNYALFPHMTVAGNIGYPLKLRGVSKSEIKKKVEEALELVQLPGFGSRKPSELSGGQRQRIAIARAIVAQPKVLLLDEPLGALDLRLRRQMQIELKRLQKQLGLTFIYITHDQEEALNMSDRVAVMRSGLLEQIGSPADIYDRPRTSYVARFVGSANIITGTVIGQEGETVTFKAPGGTGSALANGKTYQPGEQIAAAVRSEQLTLSTDESAAGLRATIREKSFAGGMLRIALLLEDGSEIVASRHGIDSELVPGDTVIAGFAPESAVLVELNDAPETPASEKAIAGGEANG